MAERAVRLLIVAITLASTASVSAPRRPNVVLVSIDTLRADHLPFHGYATDTAPFLRALASGGTVFEEALVPLPNTTPSHGSLLTSLLPSQHGSVSLTTPLRKDVDTLAAAFDRMGYATGGFVAVHHVGREFNFDKGFDAFTEPEGLARPGDAVNADAIAWLDRVRTQTPGSPVFLFVHYFDVHAPYGWWKGPEAAAVDMDTLPVEERIRRYDESIRHADRLVRDLHAALKERGFLEDAVFCVTSDHGEQIGEHGVAAGHADLYRETVRVPLVVSATGVPPARVRKTVSTMDLGVSLLAWAGGSYRAPVAGRSVFPAQDRDARDANGEGAGEDRSFLVTGNPPFTRSVALAEGRYWFIKNLDSAYRNVRLGVGPGRKEPGFSELPPAAKLADGTPRTISRTAFEPYVVTVDVQPTPTCPVDVVVSVPPGVEYVHVPRRGEPLRMQFGASRLDAVTVTTKPAACGAAVSYRLDRPGGEPAVVGAAAAETALYERLFAARKSRDEDELYDVSADPGMTRNLVASEAVQSVRRKMERALREIYAETSERGAGGETRTVSSEELKRLKSLGYLF